MSLSSPSTATVIDDDLPLYEHQVHYALTGERVDRTSGAQMRKELHQSVNALGIPALRETILERLHQLFRECYGERRILRYILGAHFLGTAWKNPPWEKEELPDADRVNDHFERHLTLSEQPDDFSTRALDRYEEALYGSGKDPSRHLIGGIATAYFYLSQFVLVAPKAYEEAKLKGDTLSRAEVTERSLTALTHQFGRLDGESFKIATHRGGSRPLPGIGLKAEPHVTQSAQNYALQQSSQPLVELASGEEQESFRHGLRCLALYAKAPNRKSVFDDVIGRYTAHWKKEWLPLLENNETNLYESTIKKWCTDQQRLLVGKPKEY